MTRDERRDAAVAGAKTDAERIYRYYRFVMSEILDQEPELKEKLLRESVGSN